MGCTGAWGALPTALGHRAVQAHRIEWFQKTQMGLVRSSVSSSRNCTVTGLSKARGRSSSSSWTLMLTTGVLMTGRLGTLGRQAQLPQYSREWHARILSRFSHARLCTTLWTATRQAPLSIGFSRQDYWSGLPCPPPGDLLNPGIKPTSLMSPALAGGFFTTSATWEALAMIMH